MINKNTLTIILCEDCGTPGAILCQRGGPTIKIGELVNSDVTDDFCDNCNNKGKHTFEAKLTKECCNCNENHIHGHMDKHTHPAERKVLKYVMHKMKFMEDALDDHDKKENSHKNTKVLLKSIKNLINGYVTENSNQEKYKRAHESIKNEEYTLLHSFRDRINYLITQKGIAFLVQGEDIKAWNVKREENNVKFTIRNSQIIDFYESISCALNKPVFFSILMFFIEGEQLRAIWFYPNLTQYGKMSFRNGKKIPLHEFVKVCSSQYLIEHTYKRNFTGVFPCREVAHVA